MLLIALFKRAAYPYIDRWRPPTTAGLASRVWVQSSTIQRTSAPSESYICPSYTCEVVSSKLYRPIFFPFLKEHREKVQAIKSASRAKSISLSLSSASSNMKTSAYTIYYYRFKERKLSIGLERAGVFTRANERKVLYPGEREK